jgi:hypothetical protein
MDKYCFGYCIFYFSHAVVLFRVQLRGKTAIMPTPRTTLRGIDVWCAYDEIVAIGELKPLDKNPNKHPERQIEMLANIIEKQGWRAPITVSHLSGSMTRGHGRLSAAKRLGATDVPVEYQDYESEAAEWADVVADNKIASYAELDVTLVSEVLDGLDLEDFDLTLTGFELEDLDLGEPAPPRTRDAPPKDSQGAELRKKWKVEPGQLWQLGRHRLLCGDARDLREIQRLKDGKKPDMIFADPPYGVDYSSRVDKERRKPWGTITNDNLDEDALGELLAQAIPGNIEPRFVCCDWHCYSLFEKALGKPKAVCVWDKGHFGLGKGYRRQHEFILFYGTLNRTDLSDMWHFSRAADYVHPTQKPVELVEKAIRDVGGGVVYDPFCGSGSTIIACENLTCTCLGMEIEPEYVAVTIERFRDVTGQDGQLVKSK